jgi:chaperonin GroEL (HSP60 family)
VATKAPEFGDAQKAALQDIAILTGAKFYSKDLGMALKDVTIQDLGQAKKVTVKKDTTTIVGGEGSKKDLADRIANSRPNTRPRLRNTIRKASPNGLPNSRMASPFSKSALRPRAR